MNRRLWIGGALVVSLAAGAAVGRADDAVYADSSYRPYRHQPRYEPRYEGPWGQNELRLRLGVFTPDGSGDYFRAAKRDFTGGAADLQDIVGGMDYVHRFDRNLGFMISTDSFRGQMNQSYRNFVDNTGHEIVHTTTLEVVPVTAGLVLRLAPAGSPIDPYIGAGGGVYVFRLRESGDFLDLSHNNEVFSATFTDSGSAPGWYALAGLQVPLSPYFSFFAEGRWDRARKNLSGDFDGLGSLDLSGRRVMGGVAWRF